MNIIRFFWKKIDFFSCYSLYNTLYLNFKVFPIKIALKLPIYVGKRVEMIGLHRGCIEFEKDITISKGIVNLFVSPSTPMFSNKGWSLLRFLSDGKLVLGKNIELYNLSSLIITEVGVLNIGSNFLMNQRSLIYCARKVDIGRCCRIGWNCQITDNDFHLLYNDNSKTIKSPYGNVILGNNVWLANSVTVVKNCNIPAYSIVANHSMINKDFSQIKTKGNLFIGSPAILKKTGLFRLLDKKFEDEQKAYFKTHNLLQVDEEFDYMRYL